ncbi:MAG: hypothetical protein LQ352_007903, partial [Teloschistes flavicans]
MEWSRKQAHDLQAVEQGIRRLGMEKDGTFFQELRAREAERKAAMEEKAEAKAEREAKEATEKKKNREEEIKDKNSWCNMT